MNFSINVDIIQKIRSQDLLTYLALILAYKAYAWSVNRDLNSWKSLFASLKVDLTNYKSWLGSEYYDERYKCKNSYNPYKVVLPLSFESLPEIIRRGVSEFTWVSTKFTEQLSLFNERVAAFNSLLEYIKISVSSDPISTEKLIDELNKLDYKDDNVSFDELKKRILQSKQQKEVLYLAENIRRLNRILHVELIGNSTNEDKLHYLYTEINNELDNIRSIFDSKKPWFIRYEPTILFLSLITFVIIEFFLGE